MMKNLTLQPNRFTGKIKQEDVFSPIPGAVWYTAKRQGDWLKGGDGLSYRFPQGALAGMKWLSADLMVDGNHLVVFILALQQGAGGPEFRLQFSALNQCSARLRMDMGATRQNQWRYEREGAWLKPMCSGDIVDLKKVDRLSLFVLRKSHLPARFCITPIMASAQKPPLLK